MKRKLGHLNCRVANITQRYISNDLGRHLFIGCTLVLHVISVGLHKGTIFKIKGIGHGELHFEAEKWRRSPTEDTAVPERDIKIKPSPQNTLE